MSLQYSVVPKSVTIQQPFSLFVKEAKMMNSHTGRAPNTQYISVSRSDSSFHQHLLPTTWITALVTVL
jgi:hypothetical protein